MSNPVTPSNNPERIQALENELAVVRSELQNLQSARSVRIAKYVKQAAKSRPAEWPSLVKGAPQVLKRAPTQTAEKHSKVNTSAGFNPLHNSLPLFKFPNVNIIAVGSYANRLFQPCCNVIAANDRRFNELNEYSAIAAVIISTDSYTNELPNIRSALQNGAHLIVIAPEESTIAKKIAQDTGKTPHVFTQSLKDGEYIRPFIDIYKHQSHSVAIAGARQIVTNDEKIDSSVAGIPVVYEKDPSDATYEAGNIAVLKEPSDTKSVEAYLELLCRGVPVVLVSPVSTSLLPEEILRTSYEELSSHVQGFQKPFALERYSEICKRAVVLEKNPLPIVEAILKSTHIQEKTFSPTISIVLASKRPQYIKQALLQLEQQTILPSEVLINLHGATKDDYALVTSIAKKSSLVVHVNEFSESVLFGEVLNAAVDQATGEFITKIDDDDYYGPNHLKDLYAAFISSCADFVGKWSNWVYLKAEDKIISWVPENQNAYVKHLPGGTVFCKTSTLRNLRFGLVKRAIDSELYRRALARGATLYSTHRYNYVRVRDNGHTYKTTDADFKSRAHSELIQGLDLEKTYC